MRAAYIHKAEHLEERRLMLQWWADFLDANRERFISPFEYAKINNPLKTVIIPANAREPTPGLFSLLKKGNDSNLLIVFYVQIMPDDFVMQLHRF